MILSKYNNKYKRGSQKGAWVFRHCDKDNNSVILKNRIRKRARMEPEKHERYGRTALELLAAGSLVGLSQKF